MTADDNQVSDNPESVELPNPTFSSESASSTSDADALVGKLAEKLMPKFEEIIERKVQSTKDKRLSDVDKIKKALGGRLDLLAELESEGVSIPKDVRSELRIRDLEERLTQQTVQPVSNVDNGMSTKTATAEAIAELTNYGLDQNDPTFIELLRGKYANRDAFDVKVQRYILGKVKPPKPANPADVVQSAATGAVKEKSVEALTTEYKTKMIAARGNKALLKQLKTEYREKGADVDHVPFSV